MIAIHPNLDRFVPAGLAPARVGLSPSEFRAVARMPSRLPVYRFPAVARRGGPVERYLLADLRALASGALS